MIYNNLAEKEFPIEYDEDENELPNYDLERLKYVLLQKNEFQRGEDKKVTRTSVLDRCLTESTVRDMYLKIGRLCDTFTIFDLFSGQSGVHELLSKQTPAILGELVSCLGRSYATNKVNTLKWPED